MEDRDQIIGHSKMWLSEMRYRIRNMPDKKYLGNNIEAWLNELEQILNGHWVTPTYSTNKKLS